MRLPGTKIWRAFPELDSFDDARASQFVHAACRAFWLVKFVRGAAMFFGGLGCVVVMILACGVVMNTLERVIKEPMLTALLGLTALIVGVLSMCVLMIVRDFFMRRRVRKVIASRGSCVNCGYVLVGLRVPADLHLRCPECGTLTVLNPDLDEIALGADGVERRFLARHEGALPVRFWTPRRRRAVTIAAVLSVVGPLVGAAAWWGVRTYKTARDAERAKALLVSTFSFQRYYDGLLAEGEAGDVKDSAFTRMESLHRFVTLRERELAEEAMQTPGVGYEAWPDYTLLWDESGFAPDQNLTAEDQEQQTERYQFSARMAEKTVEVFLTSPEADRLAKQFVESKNFACSFPTPTEPSLDRMVTNPGVTRVLNRFAVGVMHTAMKRGDRARFMLWLRVAVRCAELNDRVPTLLTWLISSATDSHLNAYMLRVGIKAVPNAWLDEISQIVLEGQRRRLTDRQMFSGEIIWCGEILSSYFAYPSALGNLASDARLWSANRPTRAGTLSENIEHLQLLEPWYLSSLTNDHWDITKPLVPSPATDLALHQGSSAMVPRFALEKQWNRLHRQIVLLVLAIERHRRDEGKLPETLEALMPKYIDRLPTDPYSGRPVSYARRGEGAGSSQSADFILYLWGDGQDNQGLCDFAKQTHGFQGVIMTPPGTDYQLYPIVKKP